MKISFYENENQAQNTKNPTNDYFLVKIPNADGININTICNSGCITDRNSDAAIHYLHATHKNPKGFPIGNNIALT